MREQVMMPTDDDPRLLTDQVMRDVYGKVRSFQEGSGDVGVSIAAWWRGHVRWARNRVSLASDQRDLLVTIRRASERGAGFVRINQIDDTSLQMAVRAAERTMALGAEGNWREGIFDGLKVLPPVLPFPDTAIWSDATFNMTAAARAQIAQALAEDAETNQMLCAGFIQMRVYESQRFGATHREAVQYAVRTIPATDPSHGQGGNRTARSAGYSRHCEAQCSMTVRHPKGVGSGWAGVSGYDWSVLDPKAAARRALDKCLTSLNPVAIEPGRYTVILEPQAVATFADYLVSSLQNRNSQEELRQPGVWSMEVDPTLNLRMTKLGLQVIDERITISHETMDPQLGIVPTRGLQDVTWIEHGVLKVLSYGRDGYSLPKLQENMPEYPRFSFRMTGGSTTIDEMIDTTKRGILVSRFWGTTPVWGASTAMLYTGVTRDGLWLVENGKISKAIKNMRFTDSPLFVFNQVEQIGTPVPVFSVSDGSLRPCLVPPMKSRDFAFTATIDAI